MTRSEAKIHLLHRRRMIWMPLYRLFAAHALICFFSFFSGSIICIKAQHRCGFEWQEQLIKTSPELEKQRLAYISQRNDLEATFEFNSRFEERFIIPVVFHIVYHNDSSNLSDERVLEQLDRLNGDFSFSERNNPFIPDIFRNLGRESGIQFCLAQKDPLGNSSSGITRQATSQDLVGLRRTEGKRHIFHRNLGGTDIWDPTKYLNIYIGDLGDIGGYASRPFQQLDQREDAVVLNYRFVGLNESSFFNLGRIGTHEVGHYFDLEHIWGKEWGCEYDDGIRDTPRQFGPNFGCPPAGTSSCGSEDMFINFMDYVDDSCMLMFSSGQINRMKAALLVARYGLIQGDLCSPGGTQPQMDIELRAYPNPLQGPYLFLAYQKDEDLISEVQVYDLYGKLLVHKRDINQSRFSLNIENLSSGIYIIRVNDTHPLKIVKQ